MATFLRSVDRSADIRAAPEYELRDGDLANRDWHRPGHKKRRCERRTKLRLARSISALLVCLLILSNPLSARPIRGLLLDVSMVGDGRYVIAKFAGEWISIWDTERLWSPLQPSLVHRFSASYPMVAAASANGKWLAWSASKSREQPEPVAVRVCKIPDENECWDISVSAPPQGIALSPDGQQMVVSYFDRAVVVARNAADSTELPLHQLRQAQSARIALAPAG